MNSLNARPLSHRLSQQEQQQLLDTLAQHYDRQRGESYAAFWPLWQAYEPYLYQRCLHWMKYRSTEADEALSQAMIRSWEKLPKYANRIHNLRAWFSRLTYHICMDLYRDASKCNYSLDQQPSEFCNPHEKLASPYETPEHTLHRSELSVAMKTAIMGLPDRLREPFILRFCEDWSYKRIAEHLDLTEATVRKRIQQARTILRRRMNLYLSGELSIDIRHLIPAQQFKIA